MILKLPTGNAPVIEMPGVVMLTEPHEVRLTHTDAYGDSWGNFVPVWNHSDKCVPGCDNQESCMTLMSDHVPEVPKGATMLVNTTGGWKSNDSSYLLYNDEYYPDSVEYGDWRGKVLLSFSAVVGKDDKAHIELITDFPMKEWQMSGHCITGYVIGYLTK